MKGHFLATTACLTLLACARPASAEEFNVALASNGAVIQADSEYSSSPDDPGGVAPASRLIDGILDGANHPPQFNRWHSQLSAPHPHWVWIRFERPARISRVTLCRAGDPPPADFVGQYTPDGGRSLRTLFRRENAAIDAAHPTFTVEFPPVVTDNFRLLVTRSANVKFPDYTQLSELQVLGQWAGEKAATKTKAAPQRLRGAMLDRPLPADLQTRIGADSITYESPWLKIAFALDRPAVVFLSLDASGHGRHIRNLLKEPKGADLVVEGCGERASSADASFNVSCEGNVVRYASVRLGRFECDDLVFRVLPKGLQITIDRRVPQRYLATQASPLRMCFDATATPPSPMGRVKARGQLQFPVLLHFPDYATLLVRATGSEAAWDFTARRELGEVQLALRTGLETTPDAATVQSAGQFHTELRMDFTEVYPEKSAVDADPRLAGAKRGWLNIFAFRPDIRCLSNNTVSDNCLFCMYEYADQAYYTPPLFDDFAALDLVRMSLDSYFDGLTGYGDSAVFVDTDPSIVIAAWDYAAGKADAEWLKRRIADIERYADHIIAADKDGDGLAESTRAGISGSGPKGAGEWSSNWWDVISFGHNDAYGIALDYRAFCCMTDLERRLGRSEKAAIYQKRAEQIKAVYCTTFYNPQTGVLAGWRSKDGKLHDYYFTFISGIAVTYGIVTPQQGNALMDRMQAKMKAVGYANFRIGLPGNLIPVARKDYAGGGLMGQPSRDDGSDSFQSYENGGATASFAYFYIQALYSLGRKAEADRIFFALLEGYRDGVFQNGVGSGVDWKRWDGRPCGYEGLLVDTYYPLTALLTGHFGRGVPIP